MLAWRWRRARGSWRRRIEQDAIAVGELIAAAAEDRLRLEQTQNATTEILDAWKKWYREALESVRRLPAAGPSAAVDAKVAAAQSRLQ